MTNADEEDVYRGKSRMEMYPKHSGSAPGCLGPGSKAPVPPYGLGFTRFIWSMGCEDPICEAMSRLGPGYRCHMANHDGFRCFEDLETIPTSCSRSRTVVFTPEVLRTKPNLNIHPSKQADKPNKSGPEYRLRNSEGLGRRSMSQSNSNLSAQIRENINSPGTQKGIGAGAR